MGTEELRTLLNFDMSRFHICMKILLTGILPSLLSEIENRQERNFGNLLGPLYSCKEFTCDLQTKEAYYCIINKLKNL